MIIHDNAHNIPPRKKMYQNKLSFDRKLELTRKIIKQTSGGLDQEQRLSKIRLQQ